MLGNRLVGQQCGDTVDVFLYITTGGRRFVEYHDVVARVAQHFSHEVADRDFVVDDDEVTFGRRRTLLFRAGQGIRFRQRDPKFGAQANLGFH